MSKGSLTRRQFMHIGGSAVAAGALVKSAAAKTTLLSLICSRPW